MSIKHDGEHEQPKYVSSQTWFFHVFPETFSPRKALCQSARAAMKKLAMLDPQHLAIEDLEELSNLPSQSSWASTISLNGSGSIGSISWQFLRPETEISLWMSGLLLHLLKLGSFAPKLQSQSWRSLNCAAQNLTWSIYNFWRTMQLRIWHLELNWGSSVWDASGIAILTACAPLAKHSLWFSQRLLVLLLVKAANMPKSGASLAKDMSCAIGSTNSHYFHIIGGRGLYTHETRIPIKGGMAIPNIATFDHRTCDC